MNATPIVWPIVIMLWVVGCTGKRETSQNVNVQMNIPAPKVIRLADLPDSLQPKVVRLADKPKPVVSWLGKPDQVHSFIDPITKLPLAPESQGIGLFTNYTAENGLAADFIAHSAIDKMGALWFGSVYNGVSKYDGKTFTTYTTAHGLPNSTVRSIVADKKGNLWFGTDGGGLCRYDGKRFTTYTIKQGLAGNYIYEMLEDRKGNLWISTDGGGVQRYDGNHFTTYTRAQGLSQTTVWDMLEDHEGNLWFGGDGIAGEKNGVDKYDGKRFVTYSTRQGLIANSVSTIVEDKNNNLWFGTSGGGLSKFDGRRFTTYTTKQGLISNKVFRSWKDRTGTLWFGTMGDGLSKYDGNRFVNFSKPNGLANSMISCMTDDNFGNQWISTAGGGIYKYGGRSFISYRNQLGSGKQLITAIVEDKAGGLWLSTYGGGISRFDGHTLTTYKSLPGLVSGLIYSLLKDTRNTIWIGSANGIANYDGQKITTYTNTQSLDISSGVSSIAEDRKGNLWFGTYSNGLIKFDRQQFTTYTTTHGLGSGTIANTVEDSQGNLWIATQTGGVSRFDGQSFTTYTTEQGLASNEIQDMILDQSGNLLLGTDKGLSVMYADKLKKVNRLTSAIQDSSLFTTFTTKDGLPADRINKLFENKAGRLLIGGNLGIAILTKGIQSFGQPGAVKGYSSQAGYPTQFTTILFEDSKGIIWLGTNSDKTGLVRFDEKAVPKNQYAAQLVLQNVKINNQIIAWNDLLPRKTPTQITDSLATPAYVTEEVIAFNRQLTQIERDSLRQHFQDVQFDSVSNWYPIPQNLVLPYRHNNISFEFNAIETSRNFLVKYQYKLEGYDEDWSPLSTKSSATFGNMNAGTYTFRVKALSPEGVWSKPISYTFIVLPPWWQTWWAYILYALAVGGIVWVIVRLRSRQLQKENQLLEEKVNLRTRQLEQKSTELEESLATLKTTQNQLIQKEKMASLGELTAGIAHEIQNPLNLVNNFTQLSQRQLGEFADEQQNPNPDAELQTELITDLKDNLDKILHHGQRASSIVKGMLAHSRTATGEVQSTDLNALAEEYLRLAYQGQRNKEKAFNCTLVTELDPAVGTVPVMRQELGRVLVNLFTNAFYAVNQRQQGAGAGYEPEVRLSTKRGESGVELRVIDNGVGMSAVVLGKLFQPFFTTKPAGQGTGLGLSLSYDIVTRGHGGSLTVESKEGAGAEFVIRLPDYPA